MCCHLLARADWDCDRAEKARDGLVGRTAISEMVFVLLAFINDIAESWPGEEDTGERYDRDFRDAPVVTLAVSSTRPATPARLGAGPVRLIAIGLGTAAGGEGGVGVVWLFSGMRADVKASGGGAVSAVLIETCDASAWLGPAREVKELRSHCPTPNFVVRFDGLLDLLFEFRVELVELDLIDAWDGEELLFGNEATAGDGVRGESSRDCFSSAGVLKLFVS